MRARGVIAVVAALMLAGCGGAAEREVPTLRWWIGPDRVDVAALAQTCSEQSGNEYRIEVAKLPADADERRSTLIRHLTAGDESIDIIGLDTALTAEFTASELLAPVPEAVSTALATDLYPAARAAASEGGKLVAVPWWFDPQLLWFRGNAAERAGLDTTKPIRWDDLLAGAERTGVTVEIDDSDGDGLAAWLNALIVGSGGTLLSGTGREPKVGLDSDAGAEAAAIVEYFHEAGLGPGPTDAAAERFAESDGGFLLAPSSVVTDPELVSVVQDMGWAPYPVVDTTAAAPASGVNLAVPRTSRQRGFAYDAINCLIDEPILMSLMTNSGHSAARPSLLENQALANAYPLAAAVKAGLTSAAGLPQTPYWSRVRAGLGETWLPLSSVSVSRTPEQSAATVKALVGGELP